VQHSRLYDLAIANHLSGRRVVAGRENHAGLLKLFPVIGKDRISLAMEDFPTRTTAKSTNEHVVQYKKFGVSQWQAKDVLGAERGVF
jgi:hypothetical protein